MSPKTKYKINGLKKSQNICTAGVYILDQKIRAVFSCIDDFFENDSTENLHNLRISIRRFRYILEIFYDCVDEKLYNKVLNHCKKMQDLVGEGRDLDVLAPNIKNITKDYRMIIPQIFFSKIEDERVEIRRKIKLELIKFKSSKNVNKFIRSD